MNKLRGAESQLFYRGKVAAFLEERKVKDICNKDQLVDALGAAMKHAASEELAVQHKPRKPWISQDTLLLVESKRVTKAYRLKSAETMMEYAELCNIVKKSTRSDKRVWIQKQCANVEQNHTDGKEREAYIVVF